MDIGPEMSSEWAGAGPGGTASTRMRVVQAALRGFVRRKASFNPKARRCLVLGLMSCTRRDSLLVASMAGC